MARGLAACQEVSPGSRCAAEAGWWVPACPLHRGPRDSSFLHAQHHSRGRLAKSMLDPEWLKSRPVIIREMGKCA